LDPSIAGLYSGPDNLRAEIGTISTIESMDSQTRTQFMDAFAELQPVQAAIAQKTEDFCSQEFAKLAAKG
jgi:hypothetical protein